MTTERDLKIINDHMESIGWQTQSDEVDAAIGRLTPAQIVEADDVLHVDLTPYLSAFHVTWLFEVCWAMPDAETLMDGGIPDDYDPTIPLNKVILWAPQDHMDRVSGARHNSIKPTKNNKPLENTIMTTTATEAAFKTFVYYIHPEFKVGAERFITTKEICGEVAETHSRIDAPLNNNGQQVHEGWLGSWTEGNTTTDHYAHGLRTVVKIEPAYRWNHELDQPEEKPYGHEVTWN